MQGVDDVLARLGAVLVEDRVLRRVIKRHRRLPGIGLQVPHAECCTLPRAALVSLVERDELPVDPASLPERVIAFRGARAALDAGDPTAVTAAWRAIFHGRVHEAFEDLVAAGTLTEGAIRERVNRIGQTEFDEIRSVLRQEELLLPPVDETSTYIEFAALYLELAHFAPHAIAQTFPAFHDPRRITAILERDIDPQRVLEASRPPGAPEQPLIEPPRQAHAPVMPVAQVHISRARGTAARAAALAARDKGNRARAAILHLRAGDIEAARTDLHHLVARLSKTLGGVPTDGWVDALLPVAQAAALPRMPRFTPGARLLHDLQAACVVSEHEVKVVDVVTWATSRGKRPLVRALPVTRTVRIAKHLHAAAKKIPTCTLSSSAERDRLAEVVYAMVEHASRSARAVLRPKIEAAMEQVDLRPRHLPETVAQKKIVDELLDQAVAVGRISIGDLRDAISHNDLKVPDLRPDQLVSGDQLLRCDKLLASSLDGVYRRGEVYLRFLQMQSSVLFGTATGRVLCLYLLLPVLLSYTVFEGLQHMIGPVAKALLHVHPEIATGFRIGAGAAFVFLLIHVLAFRRAVAGSLRLAKRGLGLVLLDLPRLLWRARITRAFLTSRLNRWVITPAIPAAIIALVLRGWVQWPVAIAVFLVFEIAVNSRYGRIVHEVSMDYAVRSGRQLSRRIVPGLVKYTLELFTKLLELLDRGIYRVDEWLRFKTGQSRVTFVIKGVVGTVWFVATYFLRLYVNLFLEPVVNPIKHFPVVTVAAKLMVPFYYPLLTAISGPASSVLGSALGASFAAFTVFVIPGIAGFLVWELNENWKLYRSTRPSTLHAVAIGHHGESMVGFLKPGFHSGTLPKLYSKLRRAAWRDDERALARHRERLRHVEDSIRTFADRELVTLLNEASPFRATDVAVAHVVPGSNRVQIQLVCPSVSPAPTTIVFEQQSGWLVASIPELGWLAELDDPQRRVFEIALAGFYKQAGVDLVREQVEEVLEGPAGVAPPYDISDEGIVVWPGDGYETEVIYDLESPTLPAKIRGLELAGTVPILNGRNALYGREPLRWTAWTTAWEEMARGEQPIRIVAGPDLVPSVARAAGSASPRQRPRETELDL